MKDKINRRFFIKSTSIALPLGLSKSGDAHPRTLQNTIQNMTRNSMPTVPFGEHQISRLIIGSNTVNGGSHLSRLIDRSMKEYFTDEQTLNFFAQCESEGINLFQASNKRNLHSWRQYQESGGFLHYISLVKENKRGNDISIEDAKNSGVIGLAHHGEVTDALFKRGQIDSIKDLLKKIRDAGLLIGVSTHMPDVVDYVEDKGWDIDFYMTCVYERHRTAEELKALLGHVPIPVREVYLEEDPPRMYKMIQATKKTCLAFKILAAGRLCRRSTDIEKAFKDALAHIKSTDAVIVGMFPRWSNQVQENAGLVRQYTV